MKSTINFFPVIKTRLVGVTENDTDTPGRRCRFYLYVSRLRTTNYAGINFIHNHHPPRTPGDLHQTFSPTLGILHPSFCPGGGDLLGQLPRGGHLSINDVCHFWNFRYNGRNWRLTILWGLLVALKFYTFLKKIIQIICSKKLNQS